MSLRQKLKYIDPDFYIHKATVAVHGEFEKEPLQWKLFDWTVDIIVYLILAVAIYALLGVALHTSIPISTVTSGSMEPTLYRGDVVIVQGVNIKDLNVPEVDLRFDVKDRMLSSFAQIKYDNPGYCDVLLHPDNTLSVKCPETKEIIFRTSENQSKTIPVTKNGEIIVYHSDYLHKDIIHRAIVKIHTPKGWYVLTKGDNINTNTMLDEDCVQRISGYTLDKPWCITLYPVPQSKVKGKVLFKIPYIGYLKLILFGR